MKKFGGVAADTSVSLVRQQQGERAVAGRSGSAGTSPNLFYSSYIVLIFQH